MLYIENPSSTDVIPVAYVSTNIAVRTIGYKTDTGYVVFSVTLCNRTTPGTTASTLLSSVTGPSTMATSTIDKRLNQDQQWIYYNASGAVSTPTKFWLYIEYQLDTTGYTGPS
jgi:hypothetical protein